MTNLRHLAQGRECEIRVPGRCNGNKETVVLCHYRMSGFSGIGMKSPDWCAAYGCSECHAIVDGQRGSWAEFPKQTRDLMLAEAVFRTLAILIRERVIKVGK
jgi:hypothetical protein